MNFDVIDIQHTKPPYWSPINWWVTFTAAYFKLVSYVDYYGLHLRFTCGAWGRFLLVVKINTIGWLLYRGTSFVNQVQRDEPAFDWSVGCLLDSKKLEQLILSLGKLSPYQNFIVIEKEEESSDLKDVFNNHPNKFFFFFLVNPLG